jgi:hypothetical protein
VTGLPFDRNPLGEGSVEELLQMAGEFDTMAARASTQSAKQALEKLAARFRIFAAGRAAHRRNEPVKPGAPAPTEGIYELRNVFGTQAGDTIQARTGELLPRAAREFTWHFTQGT